MGDLKQIEETLLSGGVSRVVLTLWALRKMPGEPRYGATLTWQEDGLDTGRGKGNSAMDAFWHAFDAAPAIMPRPPGEIETILHELGYRHLTLGLSGLAPVDPQRLFFANARFNFDGAPLLTGRGPTLADAVKGMKK